MRIFDEKMNPTEASVGHGQYEQGVENDRQASAGHGQDGQASRCVKQALGGHRQGRVDPDPPQAFRDKLDQDTLSNISFLAVK